MPFLLEKFPYLRRILNGTYQDEITYKNHFDGAYDSNWLKEYELFYNKQSKAAPYVKRIFFKVNERYGKKAGFADVRPVTDASEVTETYLMPPRRLEPGNKAYIKCLRSYNQYGESISCTPYIMPESIFGMCIHASIWICLKILEGSIEKVLTIPEIQNLATGTPYADKQGLPFKRTARILRMCRAYAFYINNRQQSLSDEQMLMELYAYVESQFPVIVGVNTQGLEWWQGSITQGYHSIVAIGHTMHDNQIDGFIFHDESALPYQVLKKDELLNAWHIPRRGEFRSQTIRELLVAVPPEVSLPFHRSFQQFEQTVLTLLNREIISEDMVDLQFRPMLVPIYFLLFPDRINPLLVQALGEGDYFPKYVWVIYFFDRDADKSKLENAKGFFVRDATRETVFRFIFFKDLGEAVYQLAEGKTYQRWIGKINRKLL